MNMKMWLDKLYQWILEYGPRLALAVVLLVAGLWVIKLIKKWMHKSFLKHNIHSTFRPFLASLIASILYVFLLLGVLQVIGMRMTIFAALIGAVGVAAGLALSGTMQNFTSGILILILKPFETGDTIIAQTHTGKVSAIRIFYTEIVTEDNRTVIIPNSKLSNELIVNLNRTGTRRIDIELKFNFGYEPEKLEPVVMDAFNAIPEILKDPIPQLKVSAVEADGFKISMHGWVNSDNYENDKAKFQDELIKRLKTAGYKLPGME